VFINAEWDRQRQRITTMTDQQPTDRNAVYSPVTAQLSPSPLRDRPWHRQGSALPAPCRAISVIAFLYFYQQSNRRVNKIVLSPRLQRRGSAVSDCLLAVFL